MATLADILRQTGYAQNGKLATPAPIESPMTKVLADHIASLPQKTAQNIEQMNWMVQNSNPYDYTGGKNPYFSYNPKAAEEFANYVPNLMGTVIGPNSNLWNAKNAFEASKLKELKKSAQEIWEKTGTYFAPEGMARQEVPDAAAELAGFIMPGARADMPMGQILRHPELYKHYPDLAEIATKYTGEVKPGGRYRHDPMGLSDETIAFSGGKDVPLHELQHAIQTRELFPKGGTASEVTTFLQQNHPDMYMQLLEEKKITDPKVIHDLYERFAGEAEARMVQKRANYTEAQRKSIHPLTDYDVPLDELIFKEAPKLTRKDIITKLLNK